MAFTTIFSTLVLTLSVIIGAAPTGTDFVTLPLTHEAGTWYGTFNVGAKKGLNLAIDSSSARTLLDSDQYVPGPNSKAQSQEISEAKYQYFNTTCHHVTSNYSLYTDVISTHNLKASGQTIGKLCDSTAQLNSSIYRGSIGFPGTRTSFPISDGIPFYQELFGDEETKDARFGLALETSGKGKLILGGLDQSLWTDGQYHSAAVVYGNDSYVPGYLGIPGLDPGSSPSKLFPDVGNKFIVGPPDIVKALFGGTYNGFFEVTNEDCGTTVFGYYTCSSPPDFGITIGNDVVQPSINPSAYFHTRLDEKNCISSVIGRDDRGGADWILGEPWFRGKYVDFEDLKRTMSVSILKDTKDA